MSQCSAPKPVWAPQQRQRAVKTETHFPKDSDSGDGRILAIRVATWREVRPRQGQCPYPRSHSKRRAEITRGRALTPRIHLSFRKEEVEGVVMLGSGKELPGSSPKWLSYLVAENGDIAVGDAPLLEVDRSAATAPQGAIMEDLIGTVGAVEDEDGDEGKEDHEHC